MRETARRAPSPWEEFSERAYRAWSALARALILTGMLLPILALAFLTLDLPFTAFDIFSPEEAYLNPSAWLTQGQVWMTVSFLVINLANRRYGDSYAIAQVMLSWGFATVLLLAGLSYLAPSLEASDMPPARFVLSFVAAWMTAHFICVTMFDLTRAIKWWRAPLYGALAGSFVYCLIYFPFLYWGSRLPWANWMIADFAIKALLAFAFLLPYSMLRKAIPPRPGLGGK